MCGINGELLFQGRRATLDAVRAMNPVLQRRGPDDAGEYLQGPVALGHRRLSIIDLSQQGHQPMQDESLGLTLVFNGTIYNYPTLRQQLIGLGYRFFSNSDTEVILKAYAHWGRDCVQHLYGMFAFAVWDQKREVLFLARDRMGIKPLYFHHTTQHFRFASSLPALLAAGVDDLSFDPAGLHHHMTLHAVVPAPLTIFKAIRKLEPGHWLEISTTGEVKKQPYWQLEAKRPSAILTAEQWQEEIHQALLDAVRMRLQIADVPVGVLLSGGLDSSLLVALLAEAGVEDIPTFSIGFEDQPEEKGSEFEFSDAVVERYQTRHHKYLIPNAEVLQRLPEAVQQMSEPMVGQDAVAFYLLAERVSGEVKVVQSGQGADEVFAGYFWYPRMQAERGSPLQRFAPHYFDREHTELMQALDPRLHGEDYTGASVTQQLNTEHADTFMDAVLRFDVTTLIVDDPVKRVDNMTMAWGLEARVPFLDQRVVETAAKMPESLKFAHGGKGVLKQIARGRIPDAVIDRPKGYFPMPALKYVRGDFLNMMQDILNTQASRERGLFQRPYLENLLDQPEAHYTRLNGSKLWHAALLEFWLQSHI